MLPRFEIVRGEVRKVGDHAVGEAGCNFLALAGALLSSSALGVAPNELIVGIQLEPTVRSSRSHELHANSPPSHRKTAIPGKNRNT